MKCRLFPIYVRNSDNALTNCGYRAYVWWKGSTEVCRSFIFASALSTCPCHSDHLRRSIWSRIASPNTASHCTRPLPNWPKTVSFIVSSKGTALPPPPPLRTGQIGFPISGSSLSEHPCDGVRHTRRAQGGVDLSVACRLEQHPVVDRITAPM